MLARAFATCNRGTFAGRYSWSANVVSIWARCSFPE
jgi:hypothetical protein